MTKQIRYDLIQSIQTVCAGGQIQTICAGGHKVEMLFAMSNRLPMFFICWECKDVYQAGLEGKIERLN